MSDSGSSSTMSVAFVEGLYADFLRDPSSVPEDWRLYFAQSPPTEPFSKSPQLAPSFKPRSLFGAQSVGARPVKHESTNGYSAANGARTNKAVSDAHVLQDRVDALVRAYRVRGHMIAQIDPLGL